MSRILVVGMGVPGFVPCSRHAGPGLRTAHFALALSRAGHDVLLVAVLGEDETAPEWPATGRLATPAVVRRDAREAGPHAAPGSSPMRARASGPGGAALPRVEWTTEAALGGASMRALLARFAPDAVVGVTAYGAALAARLGLDVPLWADVFGDLMAEAQAKAARQQSDWSLAHFWTLLVPVLERADRWSAVSVAQSHALVGQLGLAGRLGARTAGEELVHVIPCAAEAADAHTDRASARRALGLRGDDVVLLASGGVNTWCDVETLADGVALAMQADARVHLVVTGGAIAGHDETSWPGLAARLGELPAGRVHVLGWVDSGRLAALYAAADLALHVERPLYERRLGAENRVVEWLAHGLACVTTAESEAGALLVREGLAFACRAGDAADLARAIGDALSPPVPEGPSAATALARETTKARAIAARAREWAIRERGYADTARPLLEWGASPSFARDRDGARLVRVGLVSRPETSLAMLEAYVAALPVREIARRGARWLARRAWRAVRPQGAGGATATRDHANEGRGCPQEAGVARSRKTNDADAFAGLGHAAGRPRAARRLTGALWLVAGLALLLPALLVGCDERTGTGGPAARGGPPNVLLLSIDTLRRDHLGVYGYAASPSPSPWIDRLAAGGVAYDQAVTSAPETAPALATLVTGVYQDRHGLLYNRASLADENRTLAERLKEAGYTTAGFVGNWLVDAKHGFAQGFDRFEVVQSGTAPSETTDDKLVALAGEFLRSAPGRPWMMWVHMMDPHGPYRSASPWWSNGFDYAGAPLARDGEFPASDSNFGLGVIPRYQQLEGAGRLSDYRRRYDGEIRYTDSQVGALLALLAETGQADDTIVVVTADHGESLVEHDELLQHGWFVYDTTVRVPLVVSWPAGLAASLRGTREAAEVCIVDVVPGILELAGVAADGDEFDGRPFVRPEAGGAPRVSPMSARGAAMRDAGCFVLGPRANRLLALRTPRHKLVVTPAGKPRDPRAPKGTVSDEPERVELYDLVADPGETTDLATRRPDLVEELQQPLSMLRARFRARGWRW